MRACLHVTVMDWFTQKINTTSTECLMHTHSLYFSFQFSKIVAIIISIWVLAFVAILPTALYTHVLIVTFPNTPLIITEMCTDKWPSPTLNLMYSSCIMFVQVSNFIPTEVNLRLDIVNLDIVKSLI